MTRIESAVGVVVGREHRRAGRGGQDAAVVRRGAGGVVAVVADGCGSALRSEVGAELGARLCAAAALRRLEGGAAVADPRTWERVGQDVLAQLRVIDLAADGLAADCLLFTLVGAVVTAELVAVFGLGDGIYGLDGDVRELGPFPDNAPPYLGHALVGGPATSLQLHALRPADSVAQVLIGSDGAAAVDVCGLAADPLIWRNPDGLRRRLAVLAAERGGPVSDDVALAVLRRRP
jgi:hypothetical protein